MIKKTRFFILLVGLLLSFAVVPSRPLMSQDSGTSCLVDLEFNQDEVLPSTQGFTYISSPEGVPENSVFSVSEGMLHLNSLGTHAATYYALANVYDPSKDFVLEFRLKVYPGSGIFGVNVAAPSADIDFDLGFTDSGISLPPPPNSRPFLPFNTTDDSHIYKLSAAAGSSMYELFIDGVLVASHEISGGDPTNRFYIGDGTLTGDDGKADFDYVHYCQSTPNHPPTEIPTATNTSVTPTVTPTKTPVPPTATPTDTPVPLTETPTATKTPIPPTATPTETATKTPIPPTPTATFTATPTNTPLPTSIPLAQCSEPILGAVAWLHEYSLITGGNFSTGSDVPGKAFIGGNLTSSNSATFGSQLNQGSFPATTASLEIAGSVANGNPLNINAGSVFVGTSNTVQTLNPTQRRLNNNRYVNLNQGNSGATVSINNTLSTKASTITAKLQQGALALSQIAANNSVTIPTGQPGPLTFNVTAKDSDGLAVFNVSAAIFDNNKVQQIQLNNTVNASNMLINVSGTNVNWTNGNKVGSWLTSTGGRAHTIWNFYQATTINLGSRNFMGTLLAPAATVSFQGQFNGSLGAAAVTANAAIQQPLLASSFCSVVSASLADQDVAKHNLIFLPLVTK